MGEQSTRVATVLMAGLVAASAGAACGGNTADKAVRPSATITPDDDIVSGNPPSPVAARVLKRCDRLLRTGEFDKLADSMDRTAERYALGALAAPQSDPQIVAICRVCGGTAKINLGRTEEGLADLEAAGESTDLLSSPLQELLYRAQIAGYAATDDPAGVETALGNLAAIDPQAARSAALSECRQARAEDSAVECEPPAPGRSPQSPEGSPDGPTEPQPSDEGPEPPAERPEPGNPQPVDPGPDEPPPVPSGDGAT